tara:strand:- start:19249 stop:20640 length:1392 start_codon:yes stop_codon:yes gene_type:complete
MKITSFLILVVLSVLITACGTTEVTNNETSANLEESDIEVVTSEPIEDSVPATPIPEDTPIPENTPTPIPPTAIPATPTSEPVEEIVEPVEEIVESDISDDTTDNTDADTASSSPMEINECSDIPDMTQRSMCEMAEQMGLSMEDMMEMAQEMGMLDEMDESTDHDVMNMDIEDMEGMDGINPCLEVEEEYRSRCEESIRREVKQNTEGESQESDGYYIDGDFDPNDLPKVAKANFVELDKIGRTSKLRSGVGHDYAFNTSEYDPTGASCRSMKHYMIPIGVPLENALYSITPHTFEWMSIKFFSPVDGVVQDVVYSYNSYGPEAQFTISSDDHAGYYFNFYHVNLDPSLVLGAKVTAGQYIGHLGSEEAWVEIGVEVRVNSRESHLVSFIQIATDEVLSEYQSRGLNSSADVIVTKEDRDAKPLVCDRNSEAGWFEGGGSYKPTESFMIWQFESDENWFFFD